MTAFAVDEFQDARELIETRLLAYFAHRTEQASDYGPHFRRLWELTADCSFGGKLVRPLLLLDSYQALRSTRSAESDVAVADLAVGVELLHFAFLLHDDVIDGDVQRRGRPNLVGALLAEAPEGLSPARARHWATSGALLMGDLLLSGMHRLTAGVELPPGLRSRVLDVFDTVITETVAGELTDVALGDGVLPGPLPRVLTMTLRKTASYTFELPLRIGAILAEAPAGVEEALAAACRHLGLAYQLQDDLLSTFGLAREHGKDRYSDLREGKQTALIAYARHTDVWPRLAPLLGDRTLSPARGAQAARLLVECGARGFVESLVEDRFAAAERDAAALPPAAGELLRGRVRQLRARRS